MRERDKCVICGKQMDEAARLEARATYATQNVTPEEAEYITRGSGVEPGTDVGEYMSRDLCADHLPGVIRGMRGRIKEAGGPDGNPIVDVLKRGDPKYLFHWTEVEVVDLDAILESLDPQ